MRTLNEDIRRMKQLFEAQHGVIEPLISERSEPDPDFSPSKQIEKETEYNKKQAEAYAEKKKKENDNQNLDHNWLKIVDWLVDNMGFIKQTIQSTGEFVAMKPKTSTNPKPYWFILKDGNVSMVQQRTTDTTDPNEIPNIIRKNPPQKQSDGDNLNVFLNSLYQSWKQSPNLQKAYPDLKEKMAGMKIYSSAANPVVSSYSGSTTYKVKTGDNLTKIAKTYGVTVDQILKSNPQIKDKNMIKVGEIINIEK